MTNRYPLDSNLRKVLEQVWQETVRGWSLIDAPSFRADHEEMIPQLDELCELRYLHRDRNNYRPTILGLAELDDDDSKRILDVGARLLGIFYSHYKSPRSRPYALAVQDLATELSIDLAAFQFTLVLLGDLVSCVASQWSSNLDEESATIVIGEQVLQFKQISDVVQRFSEWSDRALELRAGHQRSEPELAEPQMTPSNALSAELLNAVPASWQQLLSEIQIAINNGMTCLSVMGLRAIIDEFANVHVGDMGNFKFKLDAMVSKSLLSTRQRELLDAALEVGHAAIHRMHVPAEAERDQVLEIVVHLLRETYLLHPASATLKKSVPPRQSTPRSKNKT